jgi:DNA-binding Lrp family transcriptional regulator
LKKGSWLKDIELRLISELTKNSRRSDRQLAKVLGVSQPTISTTRMRLEREGMIDYTGVPNLNKLGYEIVAVVFGIRDHQKYPESVIQKARDFAEQHPNIIFAADGIGLGYDVMSVSIHKDYSDYAKFMEEMRAEAGQTMRVDSFLINLASEGIVQHLSLKHFAEHLTKKKENE